MTPSTHRCHTFGFILLKIWCNVKDVDLHKVKIFAAIFVYQVKVIGVIVIRLMDALTTSSLAKQK